MYQPNDTKIAPRTLREAEAAAYTGFSRSFLKNARCSDTRALAKGEAIKGPRWLNLAGAIRYEVSELDAWLDRGRLEEAA